MDHLTPKDLWPLGVYEGVRDAFRKEVIAAKKERRVQVGPSMTFIFENRLTVKFQVQEIVRILEADPKTDWSKVNLEALRQHLIDMNEVTLNASAVATPIDGGLEIHVTGAGRTLAAIQRMVPAHAAEIDGSKGWSAKVSKLADGVLLTVTTTDPKEVAHIRGLGFAGIMARGSHHQAHHLAIAKGEPMHAAGAAHTQHVH